MLSARGHRGFQLTRTCLDGAGWTTQPPTHALPPPDLAVTLTFIEWPTAAEGFRWNVRIAATPTARGKFCRRTVERRCRFWCSIAAQSIHRRQGCATVGPCGKTACSQRKAAVDLNQRWRGRRPATVMFAISSGRRACRPAMILRTCATSSPPIAAASPMRWPASTASLPAIWVMARWYTSAIHTPTRMTPSARSEPHWRRRLPSTA